MRILWVVNIPCKELAVMAGLSAERMGSGGWLAAAIEQFENKTEYELAVVTTYAVSQLKKAKVNNITYYLLSGGNPANYDGFGPQNIKQWEYVQQDFQPDLMQLWGTEFAHTLTAINTIKNIPSLIYVQGIKSIIGKYYLGGMSRKELQDSRTWKTVLFRKSIQDKQKEFLKHESVEKAIYKQADYVIGENHWCKSNSLLFNPSIKYRVSYLPISKTFFDYEWSETKMNKHTILCNASGYPIKGTHILLKALAIVKQSYPDVILKVPGMVDWSQMNFKMRAEGYFKFIRKLVVDLELEQNVQFLGMIPHSEMAKQIESANVYVMCSCVENHSSSLIEALCVGAPCVSSVVGGVLDYVQHGVNGLLYRYEEYPLLAQYIIELFEDVERCKMLSNNALKITRTARQHTSVYAELDCIYKVILKEN